MSRTRRNARPVLVNGRLLNAPQAARLKAAAQAEASGQSTQARRLRARLEAELAGAAEADWLRGALAETAALEQARGVRVEQSPTHVRILGRDGLATLRARGSLSAAQFAAGLRYRSCFDDAQPRQVSTLALQPGGAAGASNLPEAVAARMAQARRGLDRFEQALVAHHAAMGRPGLAGDALTALREVAGLGRSLRSLSTSGARRARLKALLIEALETLSRIAGGACGQDR